MLFTLCLCLCTITEEESASSRSCAGIFFSLNSKCRGRPIIWMLFTFYGILYCSKRFGGREKKSFLYTSISAAWEHSGIAFIYVYVMTATTTKTTIRRILFKLNGSSSPLNSLCVIPNLFKYLRKISFYFADSKSTVHFYSIVRYLCIVVIRRRYVYERAKELKHTTEQNLIINLC